MVYIIIVIGWAMVHSNHLKYSGKLFRSFIRRLFNQFISHGFIPRQMLRGEFRTIIKNKAVNKTSSDSYRSIMNSTYIFKLFEYCLFLICSHFLKLNSSQFGYQKHTNL